MFSVQQNETAVSWPIQYAFYPLEGAACIYVVKFQVDEKSIESSFDVSYYELNKDNHSMSKHVLSRSMYFAVFSLSRSDSNIVNV